MLSGLCKILVSVSLGDSGSGVTGRCLCFCPLRLLYAVGDSGGLLFTTLLLVLSSTFSALLGGRLSRGMGEEFSSLLSLFPLNSRENLEPPPLPGVLSRRPRASGAELLYRLFSVRLGLVTSGLSEESVLGVSLATPFLVVVVVVEEAGLALSEEYRPPRAVDLAE